MKSVDDSRVWSTIRKLANKAIYDLGRPISSSERRELAELEAVLELAARYEEGRQR